MARLGRADQLRERIDVGYWKNKVAIVFGGSAGFGKALTHELLQAGASVTIVARNPERLAEAAKELSAFDSIEISSLDVSDLDAVQSLINEVSTRAGQLDAVFNCVGKSTRENLLDVDTAKLKEMFEVNLNSTVNIARAAIPELVKSRGHLVNLGSLASKTAWPFVTSYAVSKSAMATYVHQLRLEGPPEVNYLLVCPGPISRPDTGVRYDSESSELPEHARAGGAGAKIKGIPPALLAQKIMKACQRRKRELVVPAYARLAFIASAISPKLGDWILRFKMRK